MDHAVNPYGGLVGMIVGRRTAYTCGIEDYDVGVESGFDTAAVAESKPLCGTAGDLVDRFRKFHPALLTANASQQFRERAVQPRMRPSVDVEAVADDVRERMRQRLPQILLALVEG